MGGEELGCDGCTDGEDVTLSERTGGVLDATGYLKFGVAGCGRTPLTKVGEFVESELADKAELGIEHGCHMSGIEEEAVATDPFWIIGVVLQILRIEDIDEVGSAHRTSRVSGLGFFDSRCSENTNVVRCAVQYFDIVHLLDLLFEFDSNFFDGKGCLVVFDVTVETLDVFGVGFDFNSFVAGKYDLVKIVCQ